METTGSDDHDLDLPLSANISDIDVFHFVLDLCCDLENKSLTGSIILFCRKKKHDSPTRNKDFTQFQQTSEDEIIQNTNVERVFPDIILDANSLTVNNVEELCTGSDLQSRLLSVYRADIESETGVYMQCLSTKKSRLLKFSVREHSLKIFNTEEICEEESESRNTSSESNRDESDINCGSVSENCHREWENGIKVIRINYETQASGHSLKWTKDQDGRPCMFTVGHWLNNRTWFPSQDAPSSMPTWQATIHAPPHLTVLMSGDHTCTPQLDNGRHRYFYYTTMPMPTSTLAIAVGSWESVVATPPPTPATHRSAQCDLHGSKCPVNYADQPQLPCRVFTSKTLLSLVQKELAIYIPECLKQVHDILGPHPFQRLDILIVPRCFDSLGMASPSLLLLSQSVLVGDESMCARVAHELCHSWFGLLIGPRDWTEEWLTEGFCTYFEDIVHARVKKWGDEETREHLELRTWLKQKTLLAEVEHTDSDLHTLRPNQGEQLEPACSSGDTVQYVKNGLNPDKGFMQVHYLKGFFLLRHLEKKVGMAEFLDFLAQYVQRFHTCLVTSQDFLEFFFTKVPHLRSDGFCEGQLTAEWLDGSVVPNEVKLFCPSSTNGLWTEVQQQVAEIVTFNKSINKKGKKRPKIEPSDINLCKLHPDQLVVFLELLLLQERLPSCVLDIVFKIFDLTEANPEIRHRWCELVVQHCHKSHYSDVRDFLIKDQAMGVYLYGEMMLSGCDRQREIARQCFHIVGPDMPPGVHSTVHSMLFGK